jgi:molecular chaperone Hsp33
MDEVLSHNFDKIIPFTLRKSKVRGRFVKLDKSLNGILTRHNYNRSISLCLSDALSASCCIGSFLKFNGLFTIQGSSKDSLKTILADFSSSGEIRGYANYDLNNIEFESEHVEIEKFMSKGHLAFTAIENKSNKRYQGIIPVQEGKFSNSIDYYFKNSEQINSEIVCLSDCTKNNYISAAIIIQTTPNESNDDLENTSKVFEEAKLFLNSLKKSELLSKEVSMENILYKLFHSLDVRVLNEIKVKDKCRCSLDRVKNTLSNIPEKELKEITFLDGSLEVTCEFCKKLTKFSKQDLFSMRK